MMTILSYSASIVASFFVKQSSKPKVSVVVSETVASLQGARRISPTSVVIIIDFTFAIFD